MAFDYDYTGNLALLDRRKVAFFASRVVTPALHERALRWAEDCCGTEQVVISGFQSPLEKEVFSRLLRARHPMVWALGRALYRRYAPEVEEALAEERLLVLAVRNGCRTSWQTAQARNYAIASLADESLFAINESGRHSSLGVLYGLEHDANRGRLLP